MFRNTIRLLAFGFALAHQQPLHVHLTAGNVMVEGVSSRHLLGYRRSWLYGTWAWFKQCVFCNYVFRHPQLAFPQETHTSGLENKKHFRVFKSACVHIVRTWTALSKFIFGYISSSRGDSTYWEAHFYFWSEAFLEGRARLLSGIPVRIGSSFDQTELLTFCLSYFRIVTSSRGFLVSIILRS